MAYIANTAFEVKVSNHEFDSVANITGVFQNGSDTDEICSAGFLCVKDVLTANEGYEKVGPEEDVTINNGNTWTMKAAASSTTVQTPIYACNTFNVNQITDSATGAVYKVGGNTLGLAVPAGERSTFTKIEFDGNHIYRFGAGNVSGEVSTNKFFTIDNGLLKPAAAAPATGNTPYFQLVGSGNFTQGAYNGFAYYDVLSACTGGTGAASAATDYNSLTNNPSINSVTLEGNKTTEDLHISAGG